HVLRNSLRIHMVASTPDTDMILSQIEALPTLPSVAIRLLQLTADSRSSTRELVRVIESDPSTAARVLKMSRSAHLGASATTLDRAVVLLGYDAVRALVLSMHVLDVFGKASDKGEGVFDLAGLWRHSLAVGCAAKLMAQEAVADRTQAKRRSGPSSPL